MPTADPAGGYPILACRSCGSQGEVKRVRVAQLLATLEQEIPNVRQMMLAALKNVRPTRLLDTQVAVAWVVQAEEHPPRR